MPEARPVIDRLDAFLQQHGHRCANEAEWLNPRWAEEPAQVIEMVAGYLRAGDEINPIEAEKRQRQRREEAVAWVEGQLDPIRRAVFRRILTAGDPASAGLDLPALVAERRKAYEYWFTVSSAAWCWRWAVNCRTARSWRDCDRAQVDR